MHRWSTALWLAMNLAWTGDDFPPTGDIIVGDRRLVIPALGPGSIALNPSLAQWGDLQVLAFRRDDPADDDGPHHTIGLALLDEQLRVVGRPAYFPFYNNGSPSSTAEDPRLVVVDGHLYLVFNSMTANPTEGRRALFLGEVVRRRGHDGHSVLDVPRVTELRFAPEGTPRKSEKNWAPFALEHAVHLVYQVNPPWVVRVDPAKLARWPKKLVVDEVSRQTQKVYYGFGEMRGGTPALRADIFAGDYLAFFHGRGANDFGTGRRMYLTIGFYTFAPRPPFEITRLLPFPITVKDLNPEQRSDLECAFPSGALWHRGRLVVAYGRMDRAIHLLTLDPDALVGASEIIRPADFGPLP